MKDFIINLWYRIRFFFLFKTEPKSIPTPTGMRKIFDWDFSKSLWILFNKYYSQTEENKIRCQPSLNRIVKTYNGLNLSTKVNLANTERPYENAVLNTKGKTEFQYGLFELTCKVPEHEGMFWAAFWFYSLDWLPEMDVFEFMADQYNDNKETKYFSTTFHWLEDGIHKQKGRRLKSHQDLSKEFHKYSFLWTKEKMIWYFDGYPIYQITGKSPVDPVYLVINTAQKASVEAMKDKVCNFELKNLTIYEFK